MELKPCPFCGGDGSITFDPKSAIIFGNCWDCGARSEAIKLEGLPIDDDFSDARAAWNRRADTTLGVDFCSNGERRDNA